MVFQYQSSRELVINMIRNLTGKIIKLKRKK